MIPTFAVVGQPNKGKSSIVAALSENDTVRIAPMPGTTRLANAYTLKIDGEPYYRLYDTPGFQRAAAVLAWLEQDPVPASERAERVAAFVHAHRDDTRFTDEVELLKPIIEGAGILYVVDGAKPYGREYEIEMQILRWAGRPRMALINRIGSGDYTNEWHQALDQYFSIVRPFNAVSANFNQRLDLLRAFATVYEPWREPLSRAVHACEREQKHRVERSAAEIASLLIFALTTSERQRLPEDGNRKNVENQLGERLQRSIRKRESQARSQIQGIYRHSLVDRSESSDDLLTTDLFARESWEIFGLSRQQLLVAGALTGAAAGGGLDLMLGGLSLGIAATLGAAVGSAAAYFGGDEIAKTEILGQTLGGRTLQVGPVTAANFPWVLLGRALVHHTLVSEQNHALRSAITASIKDGDSLVQRLPDDTRKAFTGIFATISQQTSQDGTTQPMADELKQIVIQALSLPISK